MKAIKFLRNQLINSEVNRFIVAGAFNTIFCYLVFTLAMFVNIERIFAMTIAYLVTIPVSFFLMGRHVFSRELSIKRAVSFFAMQVVGYGSNIGILQLMSWTGISDYLSGIISLATTAFLTFLISKNWVFHSPMPNKNNPRVIKQ